jgi:probable rRNA maturation factor
MPSRSRRSRRGRARTRRLHVEAIAGTPGVPRASLEALARWLAEASPRRAAGDVTIFLTTDARIRALNRRYRRLDRVTDVLSFPALGKRGRESFSSSVRRGKRLPTPLGDIVIARGRARQQARTAGHALGTELRVLALHGLLHLLGYDHETGDGRMASVERRCRTHAGLREGLIERKGGGRA